MKSRYFPFLLAALLVVSVLRLDAYGQDESTNSHDLVELLELQLADAQRENVRLSSELGNRTQVVESKVKPDAVAELTKEKQKLAKDNELLSAEVSALERALAVNEKDQKDFVQKLKAASKGDAATEELTARCKNLEDENSIVTQEINTLTSRVKRVEDERDQAKQDFERLFAEDGGDKEKQEKLEDEVVLLKKQLSDAKAKAKKRRGPISDDKRIQKLTSEMEAMVAVETQRKETLDDLFRKLAELKGTLKARDGEISALRSEGDGIRKTVRAKDDKIRTHAKQFDELRETLSARQKAVKAVEQELADMEKQVSLKDEIIRSEIKSRQAIETKFDRIKMTDEQRKKAMDDVLTKLATAERLNSERADRIAKLEAQVEETTRRGAGSIRELEQQCTELRAEAARFGKELGSTVAAKETLVSKLKEQETNAQRDAERFVGLEADLSRVSATDNQRRKAMDKLLFDLSSLEEAGSKLRGELDASQQEVAALKAHPPIVTKGNAPDVSADLAQRDQKNAALRQRIAALESQARDVDVTVPVVGDMSEATDAERMQWQQAKTKLERAIQELKNASEVQALMVNSLKADLAEAERKNGYLGDEANQLRSRKTDVRSSALFKELDAMNVTLREKIVQIESERQRLSKRLKKLEKRDSAYDDEISHEKRLCQKAETELADLRSREIEYQELVERLTTKVPYLEKQITELEATGQTLEQTLMEREEDLRALKMELEKREHRLIKAERVAEVLESAREDVLHASDKEKLDMNYNMAAVYAREGKFEEAEQKYLQALNLDPLDADVHYNLGILYDDELKSPAKAMLHYRRYLKLNPHGKEADQVRDWLMKLEMDMKR